MLDEKARLEAFAKLDPKLRQALQALCTGAQGIYLGGDHVDFYEERSGKVLPLGIRVPWRDLQALSELVPGMTFQPNAEPNADFVWLPDRFRGSVRDLLTQSMPTAFLRPVQACQVIAVEALEFDANPVQRPAHCH